MTPAPHQPGRALVRRAALALLSCVVACAPALVRAGAEASASEAQIKAAFIYNFTKFVEWPVGRFTGATDPIVLGVFGDATLHRELGELTRERKVNGRSILVRQVVTAQEVKEVHLVYVAAAEEPRFAALLPQVQDAAVLTVGESAAFLVHGGGIRFLVDAGKLRFEINIDAAERARLKVSSQLQKLAAVVHARR